MSSKDQAALSSPLIQLLQDGTTTTKGKRRHGSKVAPALTRVNLYCACFIAALTLRFHSRNSSYLWQ